MNDGWSKWKGSDGWFTPYEDGASVEVRYADGSMLPALWKRFDPFGAPRAGGLFYVIDSFSHRDRGAIEEWRFRGHVGETNLSLWRRFWGHLPLFDVIRLWWRERKARR
jgi:hypothetical protein